jgi:hypothetical protein
LEEINPPPWPSQPSATVFQTASAAQGIFKRLQELVKDCQVILACGYAHSGAIATEQQQPVYMDDDVASMSLGV